MNNICRAIALIYFGIVFLLPAGNTHAARITSPSQNYLGLVGYWTMDGADTVWTSATAATTLDKSGNGNTGTLTNMSRSSSPVSGKIGQGLKFDGGDDYVVKTGISLTSTSGSISGWFNIKTIPTASNAYVMAGGLEASPNNDANQIYTGVYNNAGSVRANVVILTGATTIYNHYGNTVLSTDRWYHVAYTHVDGSAPLLYIDGVLQTLTLVGGTLDNSKWWDDLVTPDFYIGARLTSGALSAFFNGTIDDVRIYNRALSATEIKQLYNLGTPNYETPKGRKEIIENVDAITLAIFKQIHGIATKKSLFKIIVPRCSYKTRVVSINRTLELLKKQP